MTEDTTIGIERVVRIQLEDLIDGDVETTNDWVSEALTGSVLLQDISWNVVGHNGDDVHLRVRGYVDTSDLDERDLRNLATQLAKPDPLSPPGRE